MIRESNQWRKSEGRPCVAEALMDRMETRLWFLCHADSVVMRVLCRAGRVEDQGRDGRGVDGGGKEEEGRWWEGWARCGWGREGGGGEMVGGMGEV